MNIHFVSIEEVIALHDELIIRFGGREGIRDYTLIHSAVERPKATFDKIDLYKTIFDKAAALIHSLILNHAFEDGNKRTGYASMMRFLNINNIELTVKTEDAYAFVLRIEDKSYDLPTIAKWIKHHTKN